MTHSFFVCVVDGWEWRSHQEFYSRGLGRGTDDLRLVLNMQQVGLSQPGVNEPDAEISLTDACHAPLRQLVCNLVAIRLMW